eukprot:1985306-Pleurochrysis_carterae.AAC.1
MHALGLAFSSAVGRDDMIRLYIWQPHSSRPQKAVLHIPQAVLEMTSRQGYTRSFTGSLRETVPCGHDRFDETDALDEKHNSKHPSFSHKASTSAARQAVAQERAHARHASVTQCPQRIFSVYAKTQIIEAVHGSQAALLTNSNLIQCLRSDRK